MCIRDSVVAIDPDPVHLAAAPLLVLAVCLDVVLGLAGDDAGVAAGARGQVHRETPRVVLVLEPGIKADLRNVLEPSGELGVLAVLLERARANEVAPFHVEVVLRRGELEGRAGLLYRGRREPEAGGGPDAVCVHARAVADTANARAPVAEMQRHDVVGLAGEDPHRGRERGARCGDGDEVLVLHAEPFRRREAQVRGVVPRELRERLRNFLEPAVVREAAVEDAGIGPEDDLEAGRLRRRGRSRDVRDGLESPSRKRAAFDEPVVKRLAEKSVEAVRVLLLPVCPEQVEPFRGRLPERRREHLERRLPAVERLEERLEDRDGAVESARIAPGFELVRLVHVPRAVLARLVVVEPEARAESDLLQPLDEAEVRWSVERGVAAEDCLLYTSPSPRDRT